MFISDPIGSKVAVIWKMHCILYNLKKLLNTGSIYVHTSYVHQQNTKRAICVALITQCKVYRKLSILNLLQQGFSFSEEEYLTLDFGPIWNPSHQSYIFSRKMFSFSYS